MIRDTLPKRGLGLSIPHSSSSDAADGAGPSRPMSRATGAAAAQSSYAKGSSSAVSSLAAAAMQQSARAQSLSAGSATPGARASADAAPSPSSSSLSTPGSAASASALPLSGASGLDSLGGVGGGGGTFEDRVFAIMCQVTEDFQNQIEQRLQNLQNEAQAAQGAAASGQQDPQAESRNIEFEGIKYDMQKLSQMQQAMSNVMDSMNDLAQNAIKNIKVA